MPMGLNSLAGGSILSGVLQGIEQRRQQTAEMEQKKALLKLEQDKLKLMEKEQELKGQQTQGQQVLDLFKSQAEANKPITMPPSSTLATPSGTPLFTAPSGPTKLSDKFITQPYGIFGETEEGGLGLAPGTEPSKEFLSRSQKGEAIPDKIQIADRLAKEMGITPGQALQVVLGVDETTRRTDLVRILGTLLIMTGKDVEFDKLNKAIDNILMSTTREL